MGNSLSWLDTYSKTFISTPYLCICLRWTQISPSKIDNWPIGSACCEQQSLQSQACLQAIPWTRFYRYESKEEQTAPSNIFYVYQRNEIIRGGLHWYIRISAENATSGAAAIAAVRFSCGSERFWKLGTYINSFQDTVEHKTKQQSLRLMPWEH